MHQSLVVEAHAYSAIQAHASTQSQPPPFSNAVSSRRIYMGESASGGIHAKQ